MANDFGLVLTTILRFRVYINKHPLSFVLFVDFVLA